MDLVRLLDYDTIQSLKIENTSQIIGGKETAHTQTVIDRHDKPIQTTSFHEEDLSTTFI